MIFLLPFFLKHRWIAHPNVDNIMLSIPIWTTYVKIGAVVLILEIVRVPQFDSYAKQVTAGLVYL